MSHLDNKIHSIQSINIGCNEVLEKNEVKKIYDMALKSSNIRAFVNLEQIHNYMPVNISLFNEINTRTNVLLKEIIEDTEYSRQYVKKMNSNRYLYKFFPKGWNNQSFYDCLIFDKTLAIIKRENNCLKGSVIRDTHVSGHAKEIFDTVWNLLPNPA